MNSRTVGNKFSIQISGLVTVARMMGQDAVKIVGDEMAAAAVDSAKIASDAGNARINHWSGAIARDIERRSRISGKFVEAVARWNARHAAWVNYGRGWVYPKRAKVLRFVLRDGTVVFAKRAKPAPAQHYAELGLQDALPEIWKRFDRARDAIARRLGSA